MKNIKEIAKKYGVTFTIKCPECGSDKIEIEKRPNGLRKCLDCGYKSKDHKKFVHDIKE